jgi:3-keto-5-aminohexanoate cleavage enzyme
MAWGLLQMAATSKHHTGCRLDGPKGPGTRRLPRDLQMTDLQFRIRPAMQEDRDAVLRVMEPWNMHHVPSPEMEALDLGCFFVAEVDGLVVGASGYRLLGAGKGKTTLLGVLPPYLGTGIGAALQDSRLRAMAAVGVHTVTTNADRPETIRWYKSRFGYREVGRLQKIHSFGHPDIDHWTTLEMDLDQYMRAVSAREIVSPD